MKNKLFKNQNSSERIQRYSIKKLSIGVVSVLIGTLSYVGVGTQVYADDQTNINANSVLVNDTSESRANSLSEESVDKGLNLNSKASKSDISENVNATLPETASNNAVNVDLESNKNNTVEKQDDTLSAAPVDKELSSNSEVNQVDIHKNQDVETSEDNKLMNSTLESPKDDKSKNEKSTLDTSVNTNRNLDTTNSSSNIKETDNSKLDKVSNGKFDGNYKSDKNDWEFKEGKNSHVVVDNNNSYASIEKGTNAEHILQKISTDNGKTYSLEADVKINSAEINEGIYLVAKSVVDGKQGQVIKQINITGVKGEWIHKKFDFIANSSETYIGLVKWSEKNSTNILDASVSLDNISVKENDQYQLIWEDNFSGNDLNQKDWGYELGSIRGNEQQHYTDSKNNVFLKDGNLVLKITDRKGEDQYTNPRGGNSAREVIYDSGSVRTTGKREFLYGRIEMRAKLPKGKGAFPAFWTLGSDFTLDGDINSSQGYGWPSTGEIDIMELIGGPTSERKEEISEGDQSNKKVYGTPHFYYKNGDGDKDGSYSPYPLGGNLSLTEDFYNNFHVFGINWSPDKIEWYVDGVVYNTMMLSGDERLEAAAACFNKPQYIQLNLAAGGNWAKNAGFYLGKDNTEFVIDYVKYSQNEEQRKAAEQYYATQPQILGTHDITMLEGQTPDLLDGITADKDGYTVDFSIDDEYMFKNSGGNTNVTLKVKDSKDKTALSQLEPGIYNIYYSALPSNKTFGLLETPKEKVGRKSVLLTVLPKEGLIGKNGESLSTVSLPKGWEWEDGSQIIGTSDTYKLKFTNSERTVYTTIDAHYINEKQENIESDQPLIIENKLFDGTKEVAKNNSKDFQSLIPSIMGMEFGTITFRYRLNTKDSIVRSSKPISLLSISNKNAEKEYATFFIDTKNNQIGIEFKDKPIVKVGSGFNFLSNSDWQTISYVFKGTTLKVYLNGELYGESNFSGLFKDLSWKDRANSLTVGGLERQYEGKSEFQWAFEGCIDQVLIDKTVLDSSTISELHSPTNRNSSGNKESLWDKYDEGIFEYRIPSIVKTPQGTLIAASDARKKHYNDWGDISTVVKISQDNGKTWSENITVLDMPTQPYFTDKYSKLDWNTNHTQSSFSIDPTLMVDSSGKVYLLVDVFPESQGGVQSKNGSGYEKINNHYYLNLYDFQNNKYTVRENGIVYNSQGIATDMYVDQGDFDTAFSTRGNLYKLGQKNQENTLLGNIYLRSGRNASGITKKGSNTAPLCTYMTGFLWLFTSEDQGKTWSTPKDLTPQVKEDWMGFLGTGAAAGTEIDVTHEDGSKTKRLVFPIYYTNQQGTGALGRQSSANIYSDDGGKTWHRGESPNDGRIFGNHQQTNSKDFDTSVTELTENQIIQLNNGHLLQFMRNTGKTVAIARSTDYGKTWDDNVFVSDIPEPYVNLSAIHFNLEGKEYVILSNPLGNPTGEAIQVRNQRIKGVLRIGEILPDDSIKWISSKVYEPKRFAYSSLVQLDNQNVGVVYEYNGHLKYSTFNIKEMVDNPQREDNVSLKNISEITVDDKLGIKESKDKKYIKLQFNQPIFIIGSRQLELSIGNNQRTAEYLSGDGTDTLVFVYSANSDDSGKISIKPIFNNSIVENKYGIKFLDNSSYTIGFVGEIISGTDITEMFNNKYNDNTWVFVGGEAVQNDFNQTQGIRNYVGQFEEYIRWTKSVDEMGRQRYVTNTARSGMKLSDILSNYDAVVSNYKPKAVGYMLGKEDYLLGEEHLDEYKSNLFKFIDKSLELHDNHGFVVLQTPYCLKDRVSNSMIENYISAMKEVIKNYSNDNRINRIVFVNYFDLTNNDDFKKNCLSGNNVLNAKGHLELGKYLAQATLGTTEGYPGSNVKLNLTPVEAPKNYLDIVPVANYKNQKLFVEIPTNVSNIESWVYELIVNGEKISDVVKGNSFIIDLSNFPEKSNYDLLVKSSDGSSQLKAVTGSLDTNDKSEIKVQELNKNQIKIKNLLNKKESINWLFMGDSITHAAAWTFGYDGITQLFEKFLVNDLHRDKDVVINTAVSGATVASTLSQIEQRLEKYNPDVISIMLGTNDVANAKLTPLQFKNQLEQLIEKARLKNAVVILRTPTPSPQESRVKRIPEFIEVIKQICNENEDLILVDQYTPFKNLLDKNPYLWEPENHFITDGIPLHPGPNGQAELARIFIESLGLKQYGSHIENLSYKLEKIEKDVSSKVPFKYDSDSNTVSVAIGDIKKLVNDEFSKVTLTVKEKNCDKQYTISGETGVLSLTNLSKDKEYEVNLTIESKNSATIYKLENSDLTIGKVSKTISIKHSGGYVGRYMISWDETSRLESGELVTQKKYWTGNNKEFLLGNTSIIGLTSNSKNIQVKVEECTGLVSNWWKTILDKSFSSLSEDINIELSGTTLNPKVTII